MASIIFKQERIGKNGKVFILYKFRTLIDEGNYIYWSIFNKKIRVGKFLRRTKLDELPQIINLFRGDMVLVGPRPDIPRYIERMTDEEKKIILSVKPGLTDYASLWDFDEDRLRTPDKGYDEETYDREIWSKKKNMQIKYVKERSFKTDLIILKKTIWRVLRELLKTGIGNYK